MSPWQPGGRFNVLSHFTPTLEASRSPEDQREALWSLVPSSHCTQAQRLNLRVGVSASCKAAAQGHHTACPSRFIHPQGTTRSSRLSLLLCSTATARIPLCWGKLSPPPSSACFHHHPPNSSLLSSSSFGQPSITPQCASAHRSDLRSGPWGGEAQAQGPLGGLTGGGA